MTLRRSMLLLTLVMVLAGCGAEPGRPPLVNSGSYDWHDVYWGSNGYRLPGWR